MGLKSSLIDTARGLESLAARGSGLLPGTSIQFGPPRRSATTLTVGPESGITRHALIPARSPLRAVAELADPPLDRLMLQPEKAAIREIFVAEVPQGRYWGRFHGYIIDRHDTLLTDLSPTFTKEGRRHDALNHSRLPPLREFRGSVAVINTVFGDNFHHWLLDAVPRLDWLRRAGYTWTDFDHFLFPSKLLRHHLETIERVGIDPGKVVCSSYGMHIRADRLVVPAHTEPSFNHWVYDYTPEGLRFVRELFLKDNPHLAQPHARRILVSRERAAARRLVQGDRALQLLSEFGFEKVLLEDYSLREQAAMFHQAEAVIMPTGGNLANFVFCQPGTVAVELFSPNYTPNFTHAFLGEIGLRYYGVVADKISRPHPGARVANEDIDVDPDRLASIIRDALAKRPPVGT